MLAERVYPNKFLQLRLFEGSYGQDHKGSWWVRPPGGERNLVKTEVVSEHTDGSISFCTPTSCHALRQGVWLTLVGSDYVLGV
mgnify:CR=1 FL=1